MDQKTTTSKITQVIFTPVISLICVVVFLFWQITNLLSLSDWVNNTDKVISEINLIERQIIDLETGVRGFVITGNSVFLEPYNQAKLYLPVTFESLLELTRDNTQQQERITQIKTSIAVWHSFTSDVINLKKAGGNPVPLIQSLRGKIIIDSIRKTLAEMRSVEEQQKVQRVSKVENESKQIFLALLLIFSVIAFWLTWNLLLRRRFENRLRTSEEKYRMILDQASDGIFTANSQGQYTDINRAGLEMLGYSRSELLSMKLTDLLPKEDVPRALQDVSDYKVSNQPKVAEWRLKKKDGSYLAVEISGKLYPDHQLRGIVRDISERKKAELALRDSEEKYRSLVASAHEGILIVDGNGKIEFINQQIEKMFGYSAKELVNQPIEILLPDNLKHAHVAHRTKYTSNPTPREMGAKLDLFGKRKDGTKVPVDISLSPIKTHGGTYITAIIRDITDRKEIEKERAQLLESEQKANLVKDEFLATLSHELRTPLTTILSWAQLLRRGNLDTEKTKHGLEILEQSAKAQGQLIDDLLDITRIQAGKLNLTIQKIVPGNVISAAIESTRSLAASKSIQIEITIDPLVKQIFADPARLQQIFWNLITNAIKFSPKDGRIWITVDRTTSPSGERIRIQIRDNGKGIKPEFLPIIFERFTQVDSTSTRAYGGLGLGLAIVKNLVEMHEGSVAVESPGEGKGTTFILSLPVKPIAKIDEAEAEAEAEAEVSLKGVRVLLVDDDVSAREVFAVMLKSFGAEVKTAESASEALVIFEEFKPDVLVSDIAMPIEDGYSLIKKVRALKSKLGETPALALTAYAGREDIQRMHLAGFQSHVAKPADANKLALAIARLAGRK